MASEETGKSGFNIVRRGFSALNAGGAERRYRLDQASRRNVRRRGLPIPSIVFCIQLWEGRQCSNIRDGILDDADAFG